MKTPLVLLSAAAPLLLAACVMKPPSPRASVDPAPPAQKQETDILQRRYDERLNQRTAEIIKNKEASSYAEAREKALKEAGFRPPE